VSLDPVPTPAPEAAPPGDGPAAPSPPPPAVPSDHPVAPVFSVPAFLLVLAGLVLAAAGAPLLQAALAGRLGLPTGVATGLAAGGAALLGAAFGAAAALAARRLAFYEVTAAALLWIATSVARLLLLPAGGHGQAAEGLESQGALVAVLGVMGSGALAAVAVFVGASLAYLAAGGGRIDPSLSFELYVARSHLKLSPRLLLGLFLLCVTGVVPGLLLMLVRSLLADAAERRAERRGLLHQRRRMPATMLMTLISIGGVAIGVCALTVVLAVMSGFEGDLQRRILGQNAHGMVMKTGPKDFTDWRETRERVRLVPGVLGATPFLYNQVMLAAGQSMELMDGAVLKGIDPATIGTVTELPEIIEAGRLSWLDSPEAIPVPAARDADTPPASGTLPGIVVGRELAHSLRVFVGDQVNLVSPQGDIGPAGPQPKSRPFRVAAIFYSGFFEYDSKLAYLDLAEAQRYFGTGDTVTGLEVKVVDPDAARATMKRIQVELGGYPFRTKDWGELNRNLFAALQLEKLAMAVILGFIVLVASFLVVATLIMLVLEKVREIAVLKSMGAGVPSIMRIFVAEGLIIGVIGTFLGLVLGVESCLLIEKVGVQMDPEVYYISSLPVRLEAGQVALAALMSLVLAYLATIYPATQAARLRPVDGLRSE